jgi:very-short-patch-repair endonuclease
MTASPAERRLRAHLAVLSAQGRHFRRLALVGPGVPAYRCLAARLVLAVSEPPHAPDRIRCETLEAQGFRVLIFGRRELLQGFDAVAARIAAALDGEEAVS